MFLVYRNLVLHTTNKRERAKHTRKITRRNNKTKKEENQREDTEGERRRACLSSLLLLSLLLLASVRFCDTEAWGFFFRFFILGR